MKYYRLIHQQLNDDWFASIKVPAEDLDEAVKIRDAFLANGFTAGILKQKNHYVLEVFSLKLFCQNQIVNHIENISIATGITGLLWFIIFILLILNTIMY